MSLLTDGMQAAIRTKLLAVRNDNATVIILRRKNGQVPAQTVRIARRGQAGANQQDRGVLDATLQGVVVLGATDLDIEAGDRFNDAAGALYEVMAVRPNRITCTEAEARLVG